MSERQENNQSFQSLGGLQSREFDKKARTLLAQLGFTRISGPILKASLVHVDAEIESADGKVFWCEFKGSWHGHRPGLRRVDTVKKLFADLLLLHLAEPDHPPLLVVTSHKPEPESLGETILEIAKSEGALRDVIQIDSQPDLDRLRALSTSE